MIREFEVVVAGGGIAGLSAALSSARLGSTTLVLTGGVPGGLLLSIDRIDGFPGFPEGIPGYELCPLAEEQAAGSGAELSPGELERLEARGDGWLLGTSEGDVGARTVILATGASLRELGIPGEERLRGHGVSHCASCDGPLLRDGVVAVVGGGDSALQEALTLAELTASVIVLAREESLSAQETYRQAVLHHPRIEVRHGTVVEEILGETRVTGVRTRDLVTGEPAEVELDAVFVYVGLQPNTPFLDGDLALDRGGRILTDASLRTALPGVLAAGIVRSGAAGRAAASAGDGAAAAIAARRYVEDGSWVDHDAEVRVLGGSNGS